ncbi:hypothetical protein NDU88_002396 [Pleurodeles waltl]|uniref:Uncharacterized protein n=1 Tax=Pleurodeles waltl TaxID=8319 RepID=A0AAV7VZ72_PLEWA|nr:hypothetical protein NDU88_002396 [Pleurodeles waltl]
MYVAAGGGLRERNVRGRLCRVSALLLYRDCDGGGAQDGTDIGFVPKASELVRPTPYLDIQRLRKTPTLPRCCRHHSSRVALLLRAPGAPRPSVHTSASSYENPKD